MKQRTYLDYNATAPVRPEIAAAVSTAMAAPHNASSVHSFGRDARRMVEDARVQVAKLVNAPPAQVIFNSGATEGNNTVLKYFANEHILISAIEHPSVLEAAPMAEKIPVTKDGTLDLDALEDMMKTNSSPVCAKEGPPALVSVMYANNETGVIQPIEKISKIAKRNGALLHCDAVQAAGRIPIDMTGIDFLTLSAHKLGGPQGAGALVLGLCGITPSWLDGGGQEKRARAGTENVAGIIGFGLAAELAVKYQNDFQDLKKFQDKIESSLKKIAPEIIVHGVETKRLVNTSMFSLPGALSETLLMAFDLEGIALSNGSACSSGTVRVSNVLKAMGVEDIIAAGALRVSTGWATTEKDIEAFLNVFEKIYVRLKK
jgi:cysteine desulfurase